MTLQLEYISVLDLSEKFWSAENFGPGPKFLQKYWSWTNIF